MNSGEPRPDRQMERQKSFLPSLGCADIDKRATSGATHRHTIVTCHDANAVSASPRAIERQTTTRALTPASAAEPNPEVRLSRQGRASRPIHESALHPLPRGRSPSARPDYPPAHWLSRTPRNRSIRSLSEANPRPSPVATRRRFGPGCAAASSKVPRMTPRPPHPAEGAPMAGRGVKTSSHTKSPVAPENARSNAIDSSPCCSVVASSS